MMSRAAAILFIVFLALYLATMGGHIYSPDEEILFQATKAIAERGSLAIERPKEMPPFAVREGVDGREYAQYGVGQPLLAVPFYWLGRALANSMGERPIGFSVIQYHGRTPREEWERFGVSLFNQLIAALLVVVLFSLAFDLTGDRAAAAMTAILYGAGTIAWVHSKPFFTETLATLCVFSAFALLVRARLYRRPAWIALAGCAAGYALLTRLDSIVAFPALGLLVVWPWEPAIEFQPAAGNESSLKSESPWAVFLRELLQDRGKRERIGRFAPPVALACAIILGLNWMRYGSPFATGYEAQPEGIQFVNPLLVGLYGFLFSVGKGIFFFSPPLALFFWAIRRFAKTQPQAAWGAIALIASLLLFHSKWINWPGGWCWGPRHVFMIHVFLALPICALLAARTRGVRIAYAVLLVCGIGVQLFGTSQNFIDYHFIAFRNPVIEPRATIRYDPFHDGHFLDGYYEVKRKAIPALTGEMAIPPWELPSPVSDSIWRIEASPWVMYRRMLAAGYHDWFWVERLGCRSRAHQAVALLHTLETTAAKKKK